MSRPGVQLHMGVWKMRVFEKYRAQRLDRWGSLTNLDNTRHAQLMSEEEFSRLNIESTARGNSGSQSDSPVRHTVKRVIRRI